MAVIRNTASDYKRGKVGNTTFYVAGGRQIARQALNDSNYGENASRTAAQQENRAKWANLVNFYSGNKEWMRRAFEAAGAGVSGYNMFMQLNYGRANVFLTKEQAASKMFVPQELQVARGTLVAPQYQLRQNKIILPFMLKVDETTPLTVGELTRQLFLSQTGFAEGDGLSFVIAGGTVGTPEANMAAPATFQYAEITLALGSEEELPKLLEFGSDAVGSLTLKTNALCPMGAVIHTRREGGKLYTSNAIMYNTDSETSGWDSDAQKLAAMKSYGITETTLLNPGE